jgi:ATP-dependent protease ClpP protease subunit
MGLIDRIQRSKSDIVIEVQGYAWSVGALILQAADHRVCSKNSTIMLHQGAESIEGTPQSVKAWTKANAIQDKRLMSLLVSRTQKDTKFWTSQMRDGDLILTADKALKLNVVDEII